MTRRSWITTALAATATTGYAALLAKRHGLIPPDHGGLFGVEETLTYAAQRALLHRGQLAREFSRSHISTNFPAINTILPQDPEYLSQMRGGFREWRLGIDGLVAHPGEFL